MLCAVVDAVAVLLWLAVLVVFEAALFAALDALVALAFWLLWPLWLLALAWLALLLLALDALAADAFLASCCLWSFFAVLVATTLLFLTADFLATL